MASALMIGPAEQQALEKLREQAAANPVDMLKVMEQMKTEAGKFQHMQQMNAQTVELPVCYLVTFSIEHNHPCGTCRHMSMSSTRPGRAPAPEAVYVVAEHLGFVAPPTATTMWLEDLQCGPERAVAVNIVQPLNVHQEAHA